MERVFAVILAGAKAIKGFMSAYFIIKIRYLAGGKHPFILVFYYK